MTTRLGLISDIHASPAPLKEALALFKEHDVDMILCPGDIAGYGDELDATITLLASAQCYSVLGNHELWQLEKSEKIATSSYRYISSLPRTLELSLEGKKIYMVHAQPPDEYKGGIRLLNKEGEYDPEQVSLWTRELAGFEYDMLIVGHTHQVFAKQLANTMVINPGSTTYNHSCAIVTLPDLTVDFFALSQKEIIKSWNWGSDMLAG